MRVLLLTHTYPLHPGDATAPFMGSLVDALVEQGHSVDVVLPHHPRLRQPDCPGRRILAYRYPGDLRRPWGYGATLGSGMRLRGATAALLPGVAVAAYRSLGARLREREYDVVHAHWVLPNGALAALATRHAGPPLVVTVHGTDVAIAARSRLAGAAARRSFASAAAVVAVSEQLAARAVSVGAPPGRTTTIHNGVDLELFAPRADAVDVRAKYGIGSNAFLVLAVGRMLEAKGFDYLVDAAARVDGVHVLFVGDGPQRAALERRADASRARATFAGTVERDRIPAAFSAADCVVVPSVQDRAGQLDGGPVTVLEALAAAKPLVVTPVGVAVDVVEDCVNGLVVEPASVDALAAALRRLRDDPSLRAALGASGRSSARALTWERTARAYADCYARVAGDRKA